MTKRTPPMQPAEPAAPNARLIEPVDPEAALIEARQRFIAAFPKRSDSIGLLLGMVSTLGPRGPLAPLRQIVHRTAGLAGTLGFHTVSLRARQMEELLENVEDKGLDTSAADRLFDGIQEAFARDLSNPPAWVRTASPVEGQGRRILVVEDDEDQREVVSIHLKAASFVPIHAKSGDEVLDIARAQQPSVILLDANLPGLDGYAVCRMLKSQPDLAGTPVIFMTVRGSTDDRLVGLMLGADDYLVKPVDMTELLLRIQLLLARREKADEAKAAKVDIDPPELDYESFVAVAQEQLSLLPATLALIQLPADLMQATYAALRSESRRRDLVARYDASHIILLLAEMPPAKARERLTDVVGRVKPGSPPRIHIGLASSHMPGAVKFEALLAAADEGIATARQRGELVALGGEGRPAHPPAAPVRQRTVVLGDGATDVTKQVELQMQRAGCRTLTAADGASALRIVEEYRPDVLVIDLLVPGMNAFEVLARLLPDPLRPRVIVLSERGHEPDVTRAFALGADDYVNRPFSPQELTARITRLLR